jgi:hypothetical protein
MPTNDIIKKRAYWKVKQAILSGKLSRKPCVVCGETKSQAHHDDYTKPLDVEWLCAGCHNRLKHPVTPDRIIKIKANRKPWNHTNDAKQRIGVASKERTRSDQTRARQSASIKAWWAKRKGGDHQFSV